MTPYYSSGGVTIYHGDCLQVLKTLPEHSIDAVVTDPPYGLEFMGKEWDKLATPKAGNLGGFADGNKPSFERVRKHWGAMLDWHYAWAVEALRVLKPGGHLLAFSGTRTYHLMACAIEGAGFEVRDQILWLYGQGFPKSKNLDGDWHGWGTALKPSCEPVCLARKPLSEPNVAANVQKWGTGALNIDGCRVDEDRWPANVALDEEAAAMLDAQSGELVSGANPERRGSAKFKTCYGAFEGQESCDPVRGANAGGASRFFYCPKTDRAERNAGLEGFDEKPMLWSSGEQNPGSFQAAGTHKAAQNYHPTVKPVALMRWLIRLVTPQGGVVADPFTGSGSTGVACIFEEHPFLGIEQDKGYVDIAKARISNAIGPLFAAGGAE